MSDQKPPEPGDQGGGGGESGSDRPQPPAEGAYSAQVQHRSVGARVPEHVAGGVFSTGAMVMTGQTEFVIDFIQRMGRPHMIIARVVIPHAAMPQLIEALRTNVEKYRERFGPPPTLPKPDHPPHQVNIRDIYEDLKMPDESLSGTYANAVMIGHSAAEFSFDFITNFFPTSAVAKRVFLSAPHVPPLLESLKKTWQQALQRRQQQQQQPPPDAPPSPPESPA